MRRVVEVVVVVVVLLEVVVVLGVVLMGVVPCSLSRVVRTTPHRLK